MIIGLAGKKQVGKSTVAQKLEDAGFWEISLASTMKIMARLMLRNVGLTDQEINAAELNKEAFLPILNVSYRVLLQTLGTDWGRKLNPDIWLHCAEKELQGLGRANVVISDIRFENEADWIRQKGGLIIHIIRENRRKDDHASEAGILMHPGDAVVANNGSIEGLFNRVLLAMEARFGEPA